MFKFLTYRRDWIQVWNACGLWVNDSGETTSRCHFMIDWSESRHRYRLRVSGLFPRKHGYYKEALGTLTKLNVELLTDVSSDRDRKLKLLGI